MIKHRQFASVNLPLPDRASLDVRFQSCRLRHEPKRMFALVSAVLLIDSKRRAARHKGPLFLLEAAARR